MVICSKSYFFNNYLSNAYYVPGCVPECSYEVLISKPANLLSCGFQHSGYRGLPPPGQEGAAPVACPPPTDTSDRAAEFLKRKLVWQHLRKLMENFFLAKKKTIAYRSSLQAKDTKPSAPSKAALNQSP